MLGTILVNGNRAHVLFDTGASHSFVSAGYASLLSIPVEPLAQPFGVATPSGGVVVADRVCRSCDLLVSSLRAGADVIVLAMSDFDVILGMDWLRSQRARVDCEKKEIEFGVPGEEACIFQGHGHLGMFSLVSSLKACSLLDKSDGFLAIVCDLNVVPVIVSTSLGRMREVM